MSAVTQTRQLGQQRVMQHGRASVTQSIADAIVIKQDDLFFLCDGSAEVPFDGCHGLGLYYHDCRYLNGYALRIGDEPLEVLGRQAGAGSWATLALSNPDLTGDDGELIEKETLSVRWERTIDSRDLALRDSLAVTNAGTKAAHVLISLALRARFESIFEVRGASPRSRGQLHAPQWHRHALTFAYDGADGVRRSLTARFEPPPSETVAGTSRFHVTVPPHETVCLSVSLHIDESTSDREPLHRRPSPQEDRRVRDELKRASADWLARAGRVSSDSPLLNNVIDRSLRDLHVLASTLRGRRYFAAGVPWYVTLFGRDCLVAAMETAAYVPGIAEDTLRLLALFQGDAVDEWRDEEPGKIMHELRVGEWAHLKEIPQTPYYGSVDSTPLFLTLLARHAAWTGRLDLFRELLPHVRSALAWIDGRMAASSDRYLSYATTSTHGLANQGWKDSGDAISNADGSLATPPISLIEVQAYVYAAKIGIAGLYERSGDRENAARLRSEADQLSVRINRDFWIDELDTYAIALQSGDRPARIVSSNPGHALWAGVAPRDRAGRIATRLLKEDMFSGWGIRTLSARARRYNPVGYHLGTVWPHDNAIAVAGFRRYGLDRDAVQVMTGITEAAGLFDNHRLPELFAGFDRAEFSSPVRYPVACHPQAWAAGAVPFMLESLLGLTPDAFEHQLLVCRPCLPSFVRSLTFANIRVGEATATLRFDRDSQDRLKLEDAQVDGTLSVRAVD